MRKWEAHRNYTQYAEEFELLKTRAHKNALLLKTNNKKRQEQDYTNGFNAHLSVFAQHCTSGTKHSAGVVEFVPISFWNGTWTQQRNNTTHQSIYKLTTYCRLATVVCEANSSPPMRYILHSLATLERHSVEVPGIGSA